MPGGFEWKGVALSPTVQQAAPAELTPSNLLGAAEGAYSAGSQTYRGECMLTHGESECNGTHAGAVADVPTSDRKGVGIGAGGYKQKAAWQQSRAVRAD